MHYAPRAWSEVNELFAWSEVNEVFAWSEVNESFASRDSLVEKILRPRHGLRPLGACRAREASVRSAKPAIGERPFWKRVAAH